MHSELIIMNFLDVCPASYAADLREQILALPSARSHNKRVSGYGASHLRPNPRFARTSDTRQTLDEIVDGGGIGPERKKRKTPKLKNNNPN